MTTIKLLLLLLLLLVVVVVLVIVIVVVVVVVVIYFIAQDLTMQQICFINGYTFNKFVFENDQRYVQYKYRVAQKMAQFFGIP